LFVVRVRDVLPLLAALLVPRKLKLPLAVVLKEESTVALAPFGDFDPYPRPLVIALYSLVDGYLDLAHRNLDIQYWISGRTSNSAVSKTPQCSSNVVQRAREISGKRYESTVWKSVGSATGKQPRTASHYATKIGKTPVFMRVWLQSPTFKNPSRNGRLKTRKKAFTVTYRDKVEKRGTIIAHRSPSFHFPHYRAFV
jgi:hypothetical protein